MVMPELERPESEERDTGRANQNPEGDQFTDDLEAAQPDVDRVTTQEAVALLVSLDEITKAEEDTDLPQDGVVFDANQNAAQDEAVDGQGAVFEARTGNILYKLVKVGPKVAALYTYMEPNWSIQDAFEGKPAILALQKQAGLEEGTTMHCIVIFGTTGTSKDQPYLFSSAASMVKRDNFVANGYFLLPKPPAFYEIAVNIVSKVKKGRYIVVKSKNMTDTPDSVAHKLEEAMGAPNFEEVVKRLAESGGGHIDLDSLINQLSK